MIVPQNPHPMPTTKPWLFAHRGTSTLAPENTAAAFDLALQAKADVLELDVRISKDQSVMVTHDATLLRTTNGAGRVSQYTLTELKSLDAGHRFQTGDKQTPWRGKGLTLLTLAEVFNAYPDVGINIDIKDNSIDAARCLAEELNRIQDGRWLNVCSFHPSVVQAFRTLAPTISTAGSHWDVARWYFSQRLSKSLQPALTGRAGGDVLQIPTRWFGLPLNSARFIRHAQSHNIRMVYWTINNTDQMHLLLSRGVNGLVSDNVFEARRCIENLETAQHQSNVP
jgi:glycerophosphoryl diester phosphodiesterase